MIHTREEIAQYRRKLYECLRNMRSTTTGELSLTNEQASHLAYDIADVSLDNDMQYNTPQELAELWTM